MGKTLASLFFALSAATASADIVPINTGVWAEENQPRVYVGSTLSENQTNLDIANEYTFKVKLENNGTLTEACNIEGTIYSPQDSFSNTFYSSSFNLAAGDETIRGGKFGLFPKEGSYIAKFDYNGNEISREINVVPEPSTLCLIGLSALPFIRRRR